MKKTAMTALLILALAGHVGAQQPRPPFRVEEATIDDIHSAIKDRQTTCTDVVRAYINRAKAYNGVCTALVTKDGAAIPPAKGYVRGGSPLTFPMATVRASTVLPDFDQYKGQPIDFGRMEATASDPGVLQQYGMIAGIRDAGQLNALESLNIRGERSVTCKATCDAHPSSGPLPASCPAACSDFRALPDALERAAELDRLFGASPDLTKMPMYCIPFSFKDSFDTKDMRTTASADVSYAMDAPKQDSTVVAELRAKGAIIYAKAQSSEYNAGSGNPGGSASATSNFLGAASRGTWGGATCNPYDTERETTGSSGGSAASVAANLVVCSICEQTGGSCHNPASRTSIVSLLTTKGLIAYGGGIGADPLLDRAGIHCRTVKDAALVLDALKGQDRSYFDPRDIYSALPRSLISKEPYATAVADPKSSRPLAGIRIGVVREHMVKHVKNDEAVSDRISDEIKRVLRDKLGAEIVESVDPLYPDDPAIPNMKYTFQDALAEILPFHMPEYFFKKTAAGALEFVVPGFDVTSRDYMARLAEGLAPLSDKLNLRRVQTFPPTYSFSFHLAEYLLRRGDSRVKSWEALNDNAKYFSDERRAAMENWEYRTDIRSDGITERMKMREVMQMAVNKVMRQNNLDVLVNPVNTSPVGKIGGPTEPTINNRPSGRFTYSADWGIPEIAAPAGFNEVVYEPQFKLNANKTNYDAVTGTVRSTLPNPQPISIAFWAGPGEEAMLLRVASAYEAATKHRVPPKKFGPLPKEK